MTRKHLSYYLAAFVSLITFLVYLPVMSNSFVRWDDGLYVTANSHIRSLNPAFFKWAFGGFYAHNWHPLTWVSHALDYAIWGLNPLGHHLTNVILHLANTLLVVLLCFKLLRIWQERLESNGIPAFLNEQGITIAAGVTGILFGLHPLHVESVAWVAERKDLLCGLFFLLSISAYATYFRDLINEPVGGKKAVPFFKRSYLSSLAFFALSLLSKPMAVSLPVVLLILDWYPFRRIRSLRSFGHSCVEKLPFFACTIFSSILTVMAQRGAMSMMEVVPLRARILVAVKAFVAYLGKMAVPAGLSPYYPYPAPQEVSLLSPQYLFAVILLVGITLISFITAKRQRLWLTVWGYYVITLIPVIGIVQVGGQSMADRYTYLPSLGPFFIIGLMAAWVWAKAESLKQWSAAAKGLAVVLAISLVISLTYITLRQISHWRDSITLFSDMIRNAPDAAMPHNNLGAVYLKDNRFDEAISEFSAALRISPNYAEAHYNLGTTFAKQNHLYEAINEFKAALRINPDYADAHYNLGTAYANLNRLSEAINEFKATLRIDPDYADAHYNLETALRLKHDSGGPL